jgi:hypothetical protein
MAANGLAERLITTWAQQGRDGFLLSDPHAVQIETTHVHDAPCGVDYRFRWMPHREIRGDVRELERRGILNPQRAASRLFRDPRDPHGRHCFLCAENIRACHPLEVMVPLELAGRSYFAGANFAWIEHDHYTVMSAAHVDQAYDRHAFAAMLDLYRQTEGRFRVLFNGPGAGASIPWHLHYQITTAPLPIEALPAERAVRYPTVVHRFGATERDAEAAHAAADAWLGRDPAHHSINILIATIDGARAIFIFPRDQRRATAEERGLVGGFEVAGEFVLSAPREEAFFRGASVAIARGILEQVCPAS